MDNRKEKGYTRKVKFKNKEYDEGERRRGKVKKVKEVQAKKEPVKKEVSSIKRPESIRPVVRQVYKSPEKRSAEEIALIKSEFSRRFKESLNAKKSNEDSN